MRLFIALSLPEPAIAEIETIQSRLPAGRSVPPENLHLTLAFLGDQDDSILEPLHEALMTIRAAPITLTLSGVADFGGKAGKAIGLAADGGPELLDLQSRIRSRLHGAGVDLERRRFRPHVTLSRLSGKVDPAPVLSALIGAKAGPMTCTSFGIFQSVLHDQGAYYEELVGYALV
ncbi:2'-5'-RNA ligase [Pelagimonas phthalicica]|uniref:RNA 2',3'-cyclic phosphodiesterase n=1 Tax=Pelagimonas phthalicica TaxID=1037362 RepID=A0A238J7B7_9RHOB|nr:RNA 2',3'-cyclic phosphodiesterase [Pelagimonas phthalicica]TDS95201.1 2'-5' RNA ligase [Pelagimonas phthalicica]SMX26275.1 2'-5'-RNA ligase [Pelagimonas phthalicica]